MKQRYTEIPKDIRDKTDLVRRRINPSIFNITILISVIFLVMIVASVSVDIIGKNTLVAVIVSAFLIFILSIIIHMDKISELVFSRDFKNALLAGAAGTGVKMLFVIGKDKQVVYYSPAFRDYFSYQPQTGSDSAFEHLVSSLNLTVRHKEQVERAMQNNEHVEIDFKFSPEPKKEVEATLVVEPIERPEGFFVFKIFSESENMIGSSNRNMRALLAKIWLNFLENSPIAIVLLDENGNITESNESFRIISGKAGSNKRMGWKLIDVISEDDRNKVSTLIESAKSSLTTDLKPLDVKFAADESSSASIYINPIKESYDDNYKFIAYLIDTTEQKNLEGRFAHSQKMQAVGQLAGGVAHDFNNLLTAMIGFCDLLLLRHPPGEESFADIMQIKQNANRAANLVSQLLAFSRKQTLQPKEIDITDTIAELSNLIRRLIGENIELKVKHGRNIWPSLVDHGQFEQVIINLAVNARDAMAEKGGTLTIKTENRTLEKDDKLERGMISSSQGEDIEPGDYIVIEISDTGSGMPHDIMEQIFEPFFTTKEVGEGTGLGLSTVFGIIQQSGGYIYVSSTEGKGTKFTIFLKKYEDKENGKNKDKPRHEEMRDLTGVGTVLLVEDEDPVRIFSTRALQNKGYKVLEADSGEAALEIIEEKGDDIDIVITDVVMPGMTGPTMVQEILSKHPDIEVIFISGYAEDAFLKSYGETRSFHFLPKPFTLKELASKVKDVMEEND